MTFQPQHLFTGVGLAPAEERLKDRPQTWSVGLGILVCRRWVGLAGAWDSELGLSLAFGGWLSAQT